MEVINREYLDKIIKERFSGNQNRKTHILNVVKVMEDELMKRRVKEGSKLYEDAIVLSYLHDFGYATDEEIELKFHAISGYRYLKNGGIMDVSESVLEAIAHHTESELLYKLIKEYEPNLLTENSKVIIEHTYHKILENNNFELSDYTKELIKLITLADMQVDGRGRIVTSEERVKDVEERYGESSVITKHIKQVQEKYFK